jgi:glycosyltransferase involved in cell wall biosynthesis
MCCLFAWSFVERPHARDPKNAPLDAGTKFVQMRIACVATGWYPQSPSGLEKYVYGMTETLLHAGDAVDLFLTGNPEIDSERARAYSIGRPADPLWKRMLDARRAFAKSFRGPYDIVNLHFAMNALPLIPFIDHRTPRVVHFHGPWGAESRAEGGSAWSVAIKEALERFIYRRADRFIVLSTAFKDVLVDYGIDPARISIIPMGIDCNFFVPALDRCTIREELGWPSDAVIFFTARRLVHRVGLMELLEAAKIARKSHPNFLVKIAGKGPLRAMLADAIVSLGLTDCVELLGFVNENDLVRAYQAADVTILPSQSLEGFGTIISESLACGTPAIVTPIGGMPEAVAPLSRDLIAPSSSPDGIAERMNAVLSGTLALPDGDACRAYALANYEWGTVWQTIRSVFAATQIAA